MSSLKKSLTGVIAAGIALVPALGAVPARATEPTPTSTEYQAAATKAADYIAAHQDKYRATSSTALGGELDAILALIAAGGHTDALNKAWGDVATYGPGYCKPSATTVNVGGCAKVAITVMAAGTSATGVYNNFDYLTPVATATDFNQYATNQALAMIALERANRPIPAQLMNVALAWSNSNPAWADHDTEGLMLTALSHVSDNAAIASAKSNLVNRISTGAVVADGSKGWGASDNSSGNVNTTAWVAPGLLRVTTEAAKAHAGQTWLVAQQKADGSVYAGSVASVMMATTQAVPALMGLRSYDNVGANAVEKQVPIVGDTTPAMSIKAEDVADPSAQIAPIVLLNNVKQGKLAVTLLGTGNPGEGGYCWPYTVVGSTVQATTTGTVANNRASVTPVAAPASAQCYRWKVVLTSGSSTLERYSEPFLVKTKTK